MNTITLPVGYRRGRLTVISNPTSGIRGGKPRRFYECRCDCGKVLSVMQDNLNRDHTMSCGCLQAERTSKANSTHRLHGTHLYFVWRNIINRCNNPNVECFKYYGG